MNIQRLPEYLIRWGATLGGIAVALVLAKAAGEGRMGLVSLVLFGMLAIAATLFARDRIWVLIPIAWGFSGRMPALEVPFAIREIVVFWVFAAVLTFKAFKISVRRPNLGKTDLLMGAMIFYLITTFARNPVGVEAFGSDRIGGRPYFTVFVATLAYWVLVRASLRPTSASRTLNTMAATRLFDGVSAQFLVWVPALVPYFAMGYMSEFYDGIEMGGRMAPLPDYLSENTERVGHLAAIGHPLLLYMAARYPLSALLNVTRPWRMALVIVGFVAVLLSGFRSSLLLCVAVFIVASYFRTGWRDLIRIGLVAFGVLIFCAVGNGTLFNLPRSAQRALSWLPGQWDTVATQEAKGSTEWRTEMWEIMLTTNRFIDNHWFGDGFGFKRRELERIAWVKQYGVGGGSQEDFMVTGAVHSGPVSTIRYVGYVGLVLHMAILIAIAREAWRISRRARGTPYEALAFFICVPAVIEPLFFTFVFGAFENSVPASLILLGLLRMLQNSFADHLPSTGIQSPAAPLTSKAPVGLAGNMVKPAATA